ncbi:MAG: hypothetical protein PHF51_03990 [Candidatus ainarchaeum sp.]|nr:hypothetical protein [Candidatus ainarchaeum sp.]
MEELSYEKLREVQKEERGTAMLSEIPCDFYKRVGELLSRMREEVNLGFNLEKAREYENALKVAKDVHAVREQKILLRALRAAKGTNSVSGLADEEREVFEKLKDAISAGDACFDALVGAAAPAGKPGEGREGKEAVKGGAGGLPASGAVAQQHGKKVRIAGPVPKFVGFGGGSHGPFKAGEIVFLPEKESDLLVKRNLAEYA